MYSGIMDEKSNTQASSQQEDNGSSVGTSVGIGVGVGVLLLLLIASILYNLYLRYHIKWRAMMGIGGGGASTRSDAENGRCRRNNTSKETTQIIPSASRSPGPYSGGPSNHNMRVTPSRALEKKVSNVSSATQNSVVLPPDMEERKISKVSTVSVGAASTGPQQQGVRGTSPSPANRMPHDPIYENVLSGESHYVNLSSAQGQPVGYDDELNIYEDIPDYGPVLAPDQ